MAADRSGVGEYVSGKLTGVANLASGRFAMIADGLGFQLEHFPIFWNRKGLNEAAGAAIEEGSQEQAPV
jgi:hypothetical protein